LGYHPVARVRLGSRGRPRLGDAASTLILRILDSSRCSAEGAKKRNQSPDSELPVTRAWCCWSTCGSGSSAASDLCIRRSTVWAASSCAVQCSASAPSFAALQVGSFPGEEGSVRSRTESQHRRVYGLAGEPGAGASQSSRRPCLLALDALRPYACVPDQVKPATMELSVKERHVVSAFLLPCATSSTSVPGKAA
jgi:hypothetical protein